MGAYGAGTYGGGAYGVGFVPTVIPQSRLRTPQRLLVRCTLPGATRSAYLNSYGIVGGLTYRRTLPGGPAESTLSLGVPITATIPELNVGSKIEITRGASIIWRGRVNTLTKGAPWQITCDGIGGIATRETVQTIGYLDAIVDSAIADGLPWIRPTTLGTYSWQQDPAGTAPLTTTLDQVLSSTLTMNGLRWQVDNAGTLSTVPEPTGLPTLLIRITDPAIPVGLANYATRVLVHYNDGTTTPKTVSVVNTAAETKFGRVVVSIYANYSTTSVQATAYGQAFLDRNSPRLTVTGGFTITHRQITTTTGGVIDLPDVGSVVGRVARLQFAVPLYDAKIGATSTIDITIGSATYDDDTATLVLEPIDNTDTPVQKMLAGAVGP